jgi:predicted lipoprotein with Yx(FWY)xxD motif
MKTRSLLVAAMTAALALGTVAALPVAAQDAGPTLDAQTDDLGTYLVDGNGMTLYYFTKDVFAGTTVCYGPCAEAWPPLAVAEGQAVTAGDGVDGVIGSIARTDGTLQVTYDGRPLYYWAADTQPGDTLGQDVGGVWFVAMTDGSMPANPPAITLATATSDLGTFLTGKDGLTLYYFTKDATPGVSTCEGDCAVAWPPVTVAPGNWPAAGEGVTGVLGVAPRADGLWQVTYDGRPLYYWQNDKAAGETTGQGVGDVWYVALVDGSIPAE